MSHESQKNNEYKNKKIFTMLFYNDLSYFTAQFIFLFPFLLIYRRIP